MQSIPEVLVASPGSIGQHWLLVEFMLLDAKGRKGMQRLLADVANATRKRSARQVLVELESGWRALASLHANFGEDNVYITHEAEVALARIRGGQGASANAPPWEHARPRSRTRARPRAPGPPPWSPPGEDPWAILHVRPGAPMEVVEAARRALARKAHPDAGGSEEAMKRLNDAVERIKGGG